MMKESEKDMVVSFYNQLLSKHVHHTDKCFCRFPKLTLESLFILLSLPAAIWHEPLGVI